MRKPLILVVDDEPAIRKFVRANLEVRGFEVLLAADGCEAISVLEKEMPDLLVLDITMPKMDGFEVCKRIREWSQIPIIILSARGTELDKVKCLESGADDYITKPFGVEELMARVKAVIRRVQSSKENTSLPAYVNNDLEVDFAKHLVTLGSQEVNLTATEYRMLSYLAMNAGRVITGNQLLDHVWGEDYSGSDHLLQVNIGRLRQKLGDNARNPKYIHTKAGIGYMMARSTAPAEV
ncbi:MAG TPA: response regulator transcription factor [Dehalococcoidales bacterium]|nr:response regulator transcription factor [Dehalococcoidales bacterium]